MGRLLRQLYQFVSLLKQGRFFQLTQNLSERFVPAKFFRMKKLLFFQLDQNERRHVQRDQFLEISSGTREMIRQLVHDLYEDDSNALNFYERFYSDGVEPWIARSGEHIVGVVWLFTSRYLSAWEGYDHWLLDIEVGTNDKFIANVFVHPDFRGRNIFPALAEVCFETYPESRFFSCIDHANEASIRSHEKIGFHLCATAVFVRFFQKVRCSFRPRHGRKHSFMLKQGIAETVSP